MMRWWRHSIAAFAVSALLIGTIYILSPTRVIQPNVLILQQSDFTTRMPLESRNFAINTKSDVRRLLDSKIFQSLASACCQTLHFAKSAIKLLPMDLAVNGDSAQNLRDFVGRGNRLIFSGSSNRIQSFVNKHFGLASGDNAMPSRSQKLTLQEGSSDFQPESGGPITIPYCQLELVTGARLTVAKEDCGTGPAALPCQCGHIVLQGDNAAADPPLESLEPLPLASRFTGAAAAGSEVLRRGMRVEALDGVPATVVDRVPVGPPTYGVDPDNRLTIPERWWGIPLDESFTAQLQQLADASHPCHDSFAPDRQHGEDRSPQRYAFWARDGGWRDICGPQVHNAWDPTAQRFYNRKVADARPYMAPYSPDVDQYLYTGPDPAYAYQRVRDRRDDVRIDPQYPVAVRGYADRTMWMDENDAGPGLPVGAGRAPAPANASMS